MTGFRSPGAWADTTTSLGRLMVTMPGGLAEFERDLDPRPHGEGRAPARGERQHHQKGTLARRESGELLTEIARSYNVSAATISRHP